MLDGKEKEEILMRLISRYSRLPLLVSSLLIGSALLFAQEQAAAPSPKLTPEQMAEFLLNAKILKSKATSKGITNSARATLSDGRLTHDAHIQTIDEAKTRFEGSRGTEMNFKDTWKFNVAAYRLGVMLGLGNMIPMSVERKMPGGKHGSMTWWVDDVLMDEAERFMKKTEPPNLDRWNDEMYIVRVFDQLIYNTDRNLQNLLITKDWKIWMIDHTRGFRLHTSLAQPKNLVKCERKLLAALRQLNEESLTREMTPYLTKLEIKGVLGRRDKIVQMFEQLCAQKGEGAVLYDYDVAAR
jgi:hypothetical protein